MLQTVRGAEPAGCPAIVCLRRGALKTLPAFVFSLIGFIANSEKTTGLCRLQPATTLAVKRETGRLRNHPRTNRHDPGVGTMSEILNAAAAESRSTSQAC